MYFEISRKDLKLYIERLKEEERLLLQVEDYSHDLAKSLQTQSSVKTAERLCSSYQLLQRSYREIIAIFEDLLYQTEKSTSEISGKIADMYAVTKKILE